MLYIVHLGLSEATKTPELMLEEKEAEALAGATSDVLSEFDIRPDPKMQAIVALLMVAGSVYGPRAYMIRERWKSDKKSAAEAEASAHNVHAFQRTQ